MNDFMKQNERTLLVSFIITYYNIPSATLCKCLDNIAVLSLSEYEREIIIIDDGSDESPIGDINKYRDYITYIRIKHSGLSTARNIGLKVCNGKYIQFIDANDFLIHTPYEHCLDLIRYHNPDIVIFDVTNNKNDNKAPYKYAGPTDGSEYMKHNNITAAAYGYIFKKKVLLDLRFTPGIYHEDEEFTPQLMLRSERVFNTDAKAYYLNNRHECVTMHDNIRTHIKKLNDMETIIYNLYELSATIPANDKLALERHITQLTIEYIYNIIGITHSYNNLKKRLNRLEVKGLFPLPEKNYGNRYKLLRKMVNNAIGRRILMRTIKFIKL